MLTISQLIMDNNPMYNIFPEQKCQQPFANKPKDTSNRKILHKTPYKLTQNRGTLLIKHHRRCLQLKLKLHNVGRHVSGYEICSRAQIGLVILLQGQHCLWEPVTIARKNQDYEIITVRCRRISHFIESIFNLHITYNIKISNIISISFSHNHSKRIINNISGVLIESKKRYSPNFLPDRFAEQKIKSMCQQILIIFIRKGNSLPGLNCIQS